MSGRQGVVGSKNLGLLAWATLCAGALAGAMIGMPQAGVDTTPGLTAHQQEMIDSIVSGETMVGQLAACFATGTPDGVVEAFVAAMDRVAPDRFQQTNRWAGTVASGSAGSDGEPITLTYSFVPDGTVIPNGVGEGVGVSNLFARFNLIYGGNTAAWQDKFHAVFDRWEALTGINYVYEPIDDGADMFSSPGILGVRGDLRISAKPIDGNFGILAYNNFPLGGGDMVIDGADSFFAATGSNSINLRNVVAHEHGHGMGQLHVCPILGEKLMEPFVDTSYDGPLHDDIRNAQDYYGDPNEPNDVIGSATEIGTGMVGTTLTPGSITGPAVPFSSKLSLNEGNTSPFANDEDWYHFTVLGPGTMNITLTAIGATYEDNPQACGGTANCCSGAMTDSRRIADPIFEMWDDTGTTLLATVDISGLGGTETLTAWPLGASQSFYLHVYTDTQSFIEPQMYSLTILVIPPPPPSAFNLVAPVNGSTDVDRGPVLEWSESNNADTYLVEIDADVLFGSPDVSEVVAAPDTMLDLPDNTLSPSQTYFWRVTSENGYGSRVSTPNLSSFTTAAPPPACAADLDSDGDTDVFDFAIFGANFGLSVTPGTNGDFDGNGQVTVLDFGLFAGNFGCGG